MKTGIIDVGGGMRGIYAAGVLDGCMEMGISFDLGIGVSAGSANLASYIAKQKGRNYQFYTKYSLRKEYMSLKNLLSKKSYIDLDYVYGTLCDSNAEYPLNYPAMAKSPTDFQVVATDARTGRARYFEKKDIAQDQYDVFKASSAIPFVCEPYFIEGIPYYDGALGDPIPIERAFRMGCERVVLLLTKPADVLRSPKKDEILAKGIKKRFPQAAKELCLRAEHYNRGVALAKEYARQGKILIVAPDDTCGVDTLTRDPEKMRVLYEKGRGDCLKIKTFLQEKS